MGLLRVLGDSLAAIAETKTRVAILSVASNALLIIVKVAIGILSGSVAIISEAIHSAVDLIAAVIALFAVRASGQQADEGHPYGHGKYENISGTVEALLIFVAAVWIIYEAVDKLLHPRPVGLVAWGAGVMFLSALVNVLIGRRMSKVAKETDSVALRADAWHHWTDVYTSAGVMLGLLVIWIVGLVSPGVDLRWLDSVVAIVVALLILKAAWDLTRSSARDLLDASLPDEDVDWIPGFVCKTWPDVRSFHHVRTRKAGSNRFIDFHLAVDDKMSVGEAHALGDEIVVAIKQRLPESSVQIHVEPCDFSCTESCQSGCEVPPSDRESHKAQRDVRRASDQAAGPSAGS